MKGMADIVLSILGHGGVSRETYASCITARQVHSTSLMYMKNKTHTYTVKLPSVVDFLRQMLKNFLMEKKQWKSED